MENVYYVGLDVHKETIFISIYKGWDQEPHFEKQITNEFSKLMKILIKHKNKGDLFVCYEAGCMGFVLQRNLKKVGIICQIVAPSKLPRKPTNRIKTDKLDARNLARNLRAGEIDQVFVPDEEDEATRDFIRARSSLSIELKKTRQRLVNYLLRIGYKYTAGQNWTIKHHKWLKELTFSFPIQEETFKTYYYHMLELKIKLQYKDERIHEIAQMDRYREGVSRLRCLKGIDYLTALSLISEIGDFRRFQNADAFMSYLGLIPSEYSSANRRKQGGITKAGNSYLRRLLVESSWHYRYFQVPSKRLVSRRQGQPPEIIVYADRSLKRLQKKFHRIVIKGKSNKLAVVAVSRELAGFVWGIMTGNII